MIEIVKPRGIIESSFDGIMQRLERAGRTCYQSGDRSSDGSADNFIRNIIRRGHESVIEHESVSVRIICDRSCSHQIVRSRLCSFSQESQRYVRVIKPKLVITDADSVIDAYRRGLSCKRIAALSENLTDWQVYTLLVDHNIKRRSGGSRGLVYHNFLDTLDTPEKSYLLGMILADGNVARESQLCITQHRDYIWYLKRMCQEYIQPELNLHKDNGNCQRIQIHSRQICSALYRYGIVANKTYKMTSEDTERLWNSIPPEYIADFLRGLLDGDGSIYFGFQKNQTTKRHFLQWVGWDHLLAKIKNWCDSRYGSTKAQVNRIKECKNLWRYVISDPAVVEQACNDLFKNFQYPFGHPMKTCRAIQQYGYTRPVFSSKNGVQVILPPSLLGMPSLWQWYQTLEATALSYSNLLLGGIKPEDARSVLPNAVKTEVFMTANLRQWRLMFQQRAINAHAQWQIRGIYHSLLVQFAKELPAVFGDLLEV